MNERKIIMTGGGSAGHVTPNLALIPKLIEHGYSIEYIGTSDGIEKRIIEGEKIKYHEISSGKLRRYFDLKNFSDPFKVLQGIFQAKKIIKKVNPSVVFSKGGFVSVPVVIGAYLNKIPVIAHESDMTPGLANKLAAPFCTKVCVTFPESLKFLDNEKAVLTGTPIREQIFEGSKLIGKKICDFKEEKPILLIIGGSLGSKVINSAVRDNLLEFLVHFNIIHICGKGNIDDNLSKMDGYRQFDYVSEELSHFMQAADVFISRAGANVIFEILALKKPNILIPLSAKASRGDQILNAKSFEKSGYSVVIQEEELNGKDLLNKVKDVYDNKSTYVKAMNKSDSKDGVENIVNIILKKAK
ncbi:undecaprenyldiphospho-muramoylpentapeptide beta-N-acetylglucosaminyltransferase [Clostridium sediminicola]|uniref:undecaprenyldiphospho-muramoylpentapeptide beta-N-acetylglucosaminyltransferase n=1 Tax=Clostridium sediminicola TaxID=3114879 RepID=UPI0031F249ED